MYVKSSAVKLEASCLGVLSLRLLCHSSNTFTAHLLLCWVFLGTVLSKRRHSSSSVFGGRKQCTPLSSSMSAFAIQMYHCKHLRQFKEIIARKLHKYSISNDNLHTNIQKFPKQHLISLESTRQCKFAACTLL